MKKNRFTTSLLFAALCCVPASPAFAQPASPATEEVTVVENDDADAADKIRELLMPRPDMDAKAFADAVKKAKELGAVEQQILEAEVLRVLVGGHAGDLVTLADRLEKSAADWDVKIAIGLRKKELVASLVHALRAKAAIEKGDEKAFRNFAADSLWEEPQLAGIVMKFYQDATAKNTPENSAAKKLDQAIAAKDDAQVRKLFNEALWVSMPIPSDEVLEKIADYRAAQVLANVRVPLDVKFEQADGDAVTLAELMKGKKAALLDFHASWCGPCMAVMPQLPKEAAALGPKGVVVIAFNTEGLDDAKKIKERFKLSLPVLAEKDGAYSGLLGVNSIPRYVLIGADGKVLFNGHPSDKEKLNAALASIGIKHGEEKSAVTDDEG